MGTIPRRMDTKNGKRYMTIGHPECNPITTAFHSKYGQHIDRPQKREQKTDCITTPQPLGTAAGMTWENLR